VSLTLQILQVIKNCRLYWPWQTFSICCCMECTKCCALFCDAEI